jgi:hypothetical protein
MGHVLQAGIPGLVAIPVVDGLELVQIPQHEGKGGDQGNIDLRKITGMIINN